jgi:hypothetical protein|nr:MAG TPA: hypothetical protein [Caudoviricetes sp.]
MIVKIPKSKRPIIKCSKDNWTRIVDDVTSNGHSIYWSGLVVSEEQLINITYIVGCVAYAAKVNEQWIIFDFSSSHLCHNQIKAAILELLCNYS